MENTAEPRGISSFGLHLLAMGCMLCDHLWATLLPAQGWLNWIGRIAFPIFAFLLAEGFARTHDLRRYALRLLALALVSEVPFDLMYGGRAFYPVHQNVVWTLLLGLLALTVLERVRRRGKWWLTALAALGLAAAGLIVGTVLMVDYYGAGVVTVLAFGLFRGRKWQCLAGQIVVLYWLNVVLLGGLVVPVTLGGVTWELSQQGCALLALIPIWLYRGRQGAHGKAVRWVCYAFYPAHLLVLGLLMRFGG